MTTGKRRYMVKSDRNIMMCKVQKQGENTVQNPRSEVSKAGGGGEPCRDHTVQQDQGREDRREVC